MPKGKLEFHESIDACAKREVEEECKVSQLRITGPAVKTAIVTPSRVALH